MSGVGQVCGNEADEGVGFGTLSDVRNAPIAAASLNLGVSFNSWHYHRLSFLFIARVFFSFYFFISASSPTANESRLASKRWVERYRSSEVLLRREFVECH